MCCHHELIPQLTRNKLQLPFCVGIHVEQEMGHLRNKYKIMENRLPMSLIKCASDKSKINCTINKILVVNAAVILLDSVVNN